MVEMKGDYASGENYSLQEKKQEQRNHSAGFNFPETLIWDVKLPACMSLSWDSTSPM